MHRDRLLAFLHCHMYMRMCMYVNKRLTEDELIQLLFIQYSVM